jgi:hypothetical protein
MHRKRLRVPVSRPDLRKVAHAVSGTTMPGAGAERLLDQVYRLISDIDTVSGELDKFLDNHWLDVPGHGDLTALLKRRPELNGAMSHIRNAYFSATTDLFTAHTMAALRHVTAHPSVIASPGFCLGLPQGVVSVRVQEFIEAGKKAPYAHETHRYRPFIGESHMANLRDGVMGIPEGITRLDIPPDTSLLRVIGTRFPKLNILRLVPVCNSWSLTYGRSDAKADNEATAMLFGRQPGIESSAPLKYLTDLVVKDLRFDHRVGDAMAHHFMDRSPVARVSISPSYPPAFERYTKNPSLRSERRSVADTLMAAFDDTIEYFSWRGVMVVDPM